MKHSTKDKSVLKFEVVLEEGTAEYSVDLEEELRIDETNMMVELSRQASKYAWVAALCVLAAKDEDNKKIWAKRVQAQVFIEFKKSGVPALSGVRLTDTLVAQSVLADDRYLKAQKAFNKAKAQRGFLEEAKEAFKQRHQHILALNANLREERKEI